MNEWLFDTTNYITNVISKVLLKLRSKPILNKTIELYVKDLADTTWSIIISVHKKWSLPLRIFFVNVTKSTVSCGFGHIYWKNP